MAWFRKNKKKLETKKIMEEEQKSNVVPQQKDHFSVDPAFFEYDKVKLNEFLTDDKEYKTRVLINDCPNGDYRHLNLNTDQMEIEARRQSDESAFKFIQNNFDINNRNIDADLKIQRNMAMRNMHENPAKVMYGTEITQTELDRIGQGIDKNIERISKETAAFLKNEHTKILNLNEINETLVNRGQHYDIGGSQTTKSYVSVNGGVNKYKTLASIHQRTTKMGEEATITENDIEDLNTLKLNDKAITRQVDRSGDNATYMNRERTHSLPEQFIEPRNDNKMPTKNMVEERSSIQFTNTNQLNQMNSNANKYTTSGFNSFRSTHSYLSGSDFNPYKMKSEPNIVRIDDLMVKDIQNKTAKYLGSTHEIRDTSYTSDINRRKTTSSLYGSDRTTYNNLIPFNEVKMDQRIRKSERRDFKFIHGGSF